MSEHGPTESTTGDPNAEHELLAELADDFAKRCRRGEHPSVEEYAQKHAALASQARELLLAVLAIEQCGPDSLADAPPPGERIGAVIGRYKLLERIGEGGFGVVFMAEQQHPVRRKVALKVIKPGVDTLQVIARFEAERQALALMDHENIARVFDAGATESGRPYFVMELVRGIPITDYCDENQLAPRQRLELFVQVCRAVQHAHTKGVIHRDIKPTNVLVTLHDGVAVPKVIDFGVAKATGRQLTEKTLFTNFAQMVGTPLYMSPEQAEMSGLDADTRSDIYSLGVLLYELLTGTTPIDRERLKRAAFDEVRRIIRDEEPPPPSTRISTMSNQVRGISAQWQISRKKLGKIVLGELDWIVMKALEKDRNRRYETANDFAADVQRYLNDEAVAACSPSAMYRFRKFAQRNKGAFAIGSTAAVGVLLAVILLTISNVWISRETAKKEQALKDKDAALIAARASERDAHENLQDARTAVDQMLTRVALRLAGVPQMEQVRRELLEEASKFYQNFLEKEGNDPVIRREAAWAYRSLGDIQYRLGANADAEKSLRKAFALFEELEAQSPLEASTRDALVPTHLQFARLLFELGLGDSQEHQEHVRRAARIAEGLVKEFPTNPRYADLLVTANINLITRIPRPPDQEEEMLRRNLNLTKNPDLVGYIHWQLGNLEVRQGRYPEAKKDYLKCLENYEAIVLPNPSLSTTKPQSVPGQLTPSATAVQRNRGMVLVHLADAMTADGQSDEAEPLYRRATTILDKLATDYPATHLLRAEQAIAHFRYANLLKKVNRMADAEKAYRRALELYEKLAADFVANPGYQQVAFDQRLELARFLEEAGQLQDAQQIHLEAIARSDKLTVDLLARYFPTRLKHWQGLIRIHIELGRTLQRAGKAPQAEESFRQVMAIAERLEAEDGGKPECRRDVAQSHMATAWLLRLERRYSQADKVYRWALEHYTRLASESPQAQQAREELAFAHFALAEHYRWPPPGRLPDAEKLFRQAIEEYEELSANFPDLPRYRIAIADCRERLASVLLFQGRLQEADQGFQEALGLSGQLEKEYPADPAVRVPLAMGFRHWGETLKDTARPQEAEKALRRSEMIFSKLAADFPQETGYRFECGVTCQRLVALLARDLPRLQEAEEFYRRDVDIFEKLAAEFPGDPSYRARLADAHREWAFRLRSIGRTQEATATFDLAITNFSKAIELGSNDIWGVWYPLALVHLSTGRTAEYRMLCEKLLARFGQSDYPDRWVVFVCRLAPDAVRDLARPVQIAEQMMAREAPDPHLVGILGETLYRKGDLNSAVQKLEASVRAAPHPWVHGRRLFLAMAYHRLGRTAEAQQILKETTQWMEKNAQEQLAEGAELSQPLPWGLRLELQLSRHEAEELLGRKN